MTILRKAYVPAFVLPGDTRLNSSSARAAGNCRNESAQKSAGLKNHMRFHVRTHDDRYDLLLALPGYGREDVKIELSEGILLIEVHGGKDEENNQSTWKEIDLAGRRSRFYFPEDADPENINASMKNGLLTISLFKVAEAIPQPPKAITVK